MTSRELFLRQVDLKNQWAAVVFADWFQQVMMFAMNDFTEKDVTKEQLDGAKKFKESMLNLVDVQVENAATVSSGITHNVLEKAAEIRKEMAAEMKK